jgi:thioredoxin-like negative regulator of GroEL
MQYGVRGIPTLILFKEGAEVGRLVGGTSKDNISRLIERAFGNAS